MPLTADQIAELREKKERAEAITADWKLPFSASHARIEDANFCYVGVTIEPEEAEYLVALRNAAKELIEAAEERERLREAINEAAFHLRENLDYGCKPIIETKDHECPGCLGWAWLEEAEDRGIIEGEK